jgi:hypothetical protein
MAATRIYRCISVIDVAIDELDAGCQKILFIGGSGSVIRLNVCPNDLVSFKEKKLYRITVEEIGD